MKKINNKNSYEFTKNLKRILQEKNITQLDLIEKFSKLNIKVGQATISDWLNKGNLPRDKTFEALCKILRVKESDLIPNDTNLFKYPILGRLACGTPTETFEDDGLTDVISNQKIDADCAYFARGDSMIDFGIKDRDIVFVKNYKNQADAKNGDIAVVRVNGETTLKKIHYDKKTKTTTLIPGNSKYSPLVYSEKDVSEFQVVGKAVYFQGLIK